MGIHCCLYSPPSETGTYIICGRRILLRIVHGFIVGFDEQRVPAIPVDARVDVLVVGIDVVHIVTVGGLEMLQIAIEAR